MAPFHHSHRHDRSDKHEADLTSEGEDDRYFHRSGMTAHPRRHTEPDATYRHWSHEDSEPHLYSLHRATTYQQWDVSHRQEAAKAPLVEYVCEEEEPSVDESPLRIHDRTRHVVEEPDDEETPMTIPASYHYQPSPPDPAIPEHRDYRYHSQPQIQRDPTNFDNYNQSPRQARPHLVHDRRRSSAAGTNELVDRIAEYVMSRSSRPDHMDERKKRTIEELAVEVLDALKTGSWDHVPKDLVKDVKKILV